MVQGCHRATPGDTSPPVSLGARQADAYLGLLQPFHSGRTLGVNVRPSTSLPLLCSPRVDDGNIAACGPPAKATEPTAQLKDGHSGDGAIRRSSNSLPGDPNHRSHLASTGVPPHNPLLSTRAYRNIHRRRLSRDDPFGESVSRGRPHRARNVLRQIGNPYEVGLCFG